MNIIVHGATGRMGQNVQLLAAAQYANASIAALVAPGCPEETQENCFTKLSHYTGPADCVVDFSNHAATNELLEYCLERQLPVVIATTGQTEEERAAIEAAAEKIPVFFSANMSVGVALLSKFVRMAASMFPGADIEIVETHHNRKVDVPSGTALMLANSIKEARPGSEIVVGRHENGRREKNQIGIHSLRLANETGTHEVYFATNRETIVLRHEAQGRILFSEGALKAAAFLQGKPAGLYNMDDLLAQEGI